MLGPVLGLVGILAIVSVNIAEMLCTTYKMGKGKRCPKTQVTTK